MKVISFTLFVFFFGQIRLFGLAELAGSITGLFSSIALVLLLLTGWQLAVGPEKATPLAQLPPIGLPLLLTITTLLAVLLATTLPALFLGWSLLLVGWTAVAYRHLPATDYVWRHSSWLWGPLFFWAILAASTPISDPLYVHIATLTPTDQMIMAAGLLLPLVCLPFYGRTVLLASVPRSLALLLLTWPALAAAGVMGRLLWAGGLTLSLLPLLLLGAILLIGLPIVTSRVVAAGRLPLPSFYDKLQRLGRSLYQAVRDALLLLEGEVGLLWLLGLLVLALLFT